MLGAHLLDGVKLAHKLTADKFSGLFQTIQSTGSLTLTMFVLHHCKHYKFGPLVATSSLPGGWAAFLRGQQVVFREAAARCWPLCSPDANAYVSPALPRVCPDWPLLRPPVPPHPLAARLLQQSFCRPLLVQQRPCHNQ